MANTIDRAAKKERMLFVWGGHTVEELREQAADRLEDRRLMASKGSPAWDQWTMEAEIFNELADEKAYGHLPYGRLVTRSREYATFAQRATCPERQHYYKARAASLSAMAKEAFAKKRN